MTLPQCRRYQTMRYIGITLLVVAFGLCIYFYCTDSVLFKARMNGNACKACYLYTRRHRDLRPYSIGEYRLLQQHARGCKLCSDQCTKLVTGIKNLNPTLNIDSVRKDCIDTTQNAVWAEQELTRLTQKALEKQVGGIFPRVPK